MKLMSLLLALVMALTPVLSIAEETQEPQTAEEMFVLAYSFTQGEQADFAKAEEWYLKAAALEHVGSMLNLGIAYSNGTFTNGAPDYAKAKEMLMKASELGYHEAMFALGYGYASGIYNDGNPDYTESQKWYMTAAELGNVSAMYNLGFHYEEGSFNKDWLLDTNIPDYVKAMKWYKAAWEAGHAQAGERLAQFYLMGVTDQEGNVVIAADHAQLLQILEQFYASGIESTYAMSWLGWLYAGNSDQNVCETDYLRAFEVYKRGADWGNGYCAWQIGRMYEAGRLGMVDLVAAEAWMARGVAGGETRAQEDLERVLGLLEAK